MIEAKKSLGQNFLRSQKALSQIIEAGDIQPDDLILEIGPGEGSLTARILDKITKKGVLVVIEKDDRLIPILEEKFSSAIEKRLLHIIHGDIIELFKQDGSGQKSILTLLNKALAGTRQGGAEFETFKVIANIPYYITGLILRLMFEQEELPEKAVLLVQKEVADRIVASGENGAQGAERGGKESLLSLSIKLYGNPRRVATVPRGAFAPAPAVDSAIVAIENIGRKIPRGKEEAFFKLLKAAFAHKRKRMMKNLSDSLGKDTDWPSFFKETGIDENIRAEDVTLEQFLSLFSSTT